jgi:CO/xanthine dehydrogenase Mo-binding subunit
VTCGAQDIGTGTYTMFAQVASEATGVPLDRIDVVLGDSSLPKGPVSGGSVLTASLIPAVMAAERDAQHRVLTVAAATPSLFKGAEASDLAMTAGSVHHKDQPASSGVPFDKHRRQQGAPRGNPTKEAGRPEPSRLTTMFPVISSWTAKCRAARYRTARPRCACRSLRQRAARRRGSVHPRS